MPTDAGDRATQRVLPFRFGDGVLQTRLQLPRNPTSLVICLHREGRDEMGLTPFVSGRLDEAHIGALHVEISSDGESRGVDRLADAVEELRVQLSALAPISGLRLGLFGIGRAGAAAIAAARDSGASPRAVVSVAGSPIPRAETLDVVDCPALLVTRSEQSDEARRNKRAVDDCETSRHRAVTVPDGRAPLYDGIRESTAVEVLSWMTEHLQWREW